MSDQSADAFMEWTAGIRKMLIEAGDKSAAALVDNYSFETFDAGWQASRRAALEEGYALGFEASGEGWNGEYPNRDLTVDPQWIAQRDKDLGAT